MVEAEFIEKTAEEINGLGYRVALLRIGAGQAMAGQVQADDAVVGAEILGPGVPAFQRIGKPVHHDDDGRIGRALAAHARHHTIDIDQAVIAGPVGRVEPGGLIQRRLGTGAGQHPDQGPGHKQGGKEEKCDHGAGHGISSVSNKNGRRSLMLRKRRPVKCGESGFGRFAPALVDSPSSGRPASP